MLYAVNEIFYSVQGEGVHTGTPAVFIRLAGCNLACEFCDTDHSKRMDLELDEIADAVAALTPDTLVSPVVVITGGEPLIQPIQALVDELKLMNFRVHLETNGVHLNSCRPMVDWITFSPKPHTVYPRELGEHFCDELKIVFGGGVAPEKFGHLNVPKFIQPMSGDVKPALNFVKENPEWRLSVQIQKLINIL